MPKKGKKGKAPKRLEHRLEYDKDTDILTLEDFDAMHLQIRMLSEKHLDDGKERMRIAQLRDPSKFDRAMAERMAADPDRPAVLPPEDCAAACGWARHSMWKEPAPGAGVPQVKALFDSVGMNYVAKMLIDHWKTVIRTMEPRDFEDIQTLSNQVLNAIVESPETSAEVKQFKKERPSLFDLFGSITGAYNARKIATMRKKLEQARAGTLDVKMAHFQFFRSFGENSEQIIKKFQEQAYGDPDDQPSANVE